MLTEIQAWSSYDSEPLEPTSILGDREPKQVYDTILEIPSAKDPYDGTCRSRC